MGSQSSKERTASEPSTNIGSPPSQRFTRRSKKNRESKGVGTPPIDGEGTARALTAARDRDSPPAKTPTEVENERISGAAATRLSAAYRGSKARRSVAFVRQPSVDAVYRSLDVDLEAANIVQAAGHAGIFKRSSEHTIIKTATNREKAVYEAVQATSLRAFLPAYHGAQETESMCHLFLEDLTVGMNRPAVMDIKMGVRTFLESEAENPKRRLDLVRVSRCGAARTTLHGSATVPGRARDKHAATRITRHGRSAPACTISTP